MLERHWMAPPQPSPASMCSWIALLWMSAAAVWFPPIVLCNKATRWTPCVRAWIPHRFVPRPVTRHRSHILLWIAASHTLNLCRKVVSALWDTYLSINQIVGLKLARCSVGHAWMTLTPMNTTLLWWVMKRFLKLQQMSPYSCRNMHRSEKNSVTPTRIAIHKTPVSWSPVQLGSPVLFFQWPTQPFWIVALPSFPFLLSTWTLALQATCVVFSRHTLSLPPFCKCCGNLRESCAIKLFETAQANWSKTNWMIHPLWNSLQASTVHQMWVNDAPWKNMTNCRHVNRQLFWCELWLWLSGSFMQLCFQAIASTTKSKEDRKRNLTRWSRWAWEDSKNRTIGSDFASLVSGDFTDSEWWWAGTLAWQRCLTKVSYHSPTVWVPKLPISELLWRFFFSITAVRHDQQTVDTGLLLLHVFWEISWDFPWRVVLIAPWMHRCGRVPATFPATL